MDLIQGVQADLQPQHSFNIAAKAGRVVYSPQQLELYFDRIALPGERRIHSVDDISYDDQLKYLCTLLKHHQVCIPFENLVQHYSWHRTINTDPRHVFRKIVERPGRGGYCMETNSLFHTVLLSLGFKCYTAPGRVFTPAGWTSLTHIVNLVIIGPTKFLCDVGFGKNEPLRPIPLEHGHCVSQIEPKYTRLIHDTISEYLSDTKLWVVETSEGSEWKKTYAFSEMEVMPKDIQTLNLGPWIEHSSVFTREIMCVRYTTGNSAEYAAITTQSICENEIDGILVLHDNNLKWERNGKIEFQCTLLEENDRLEQLQRYWNITFDEIDRDAIFSSAAVLGSSNGIM